MRSGISGFDDSGENRGPRRSYKAMAVRRRWWVIGPFFAIGIAGYVASQFAHPLYRSQAIILVEQQKVPEQYVTPNIIADLQYRLDSLTQQILSRTR